MQSVADKVESNEETAGAARPRSLIEYAGVVARGFCMGCADVVPGVSGGTMAFILGIYEELIQSIRMAARPPFLEALFKLRVREALAIINFPFLAAVATGILLAVVTLASSLEWLLEHQPIFLWSFFFGLVVASVIVVSRRIDRWTPPLWAALAVGTVGAYIVVGMVPVETPNDWWYLFLAGALAICAMILPGVSGAFILVMLGKYEYILSAVTNRDLVTIGIVGAGAIVGLVTFAQLLGWLFKRYHNLTVALLTGLMVGSLRRIWPWKEDIDWIVKQDGERLVTEQQNYLPSLFVDSGANPEVFLALAVAIAGFVAVILLERLGNRQQVA